MRVLAEGSHHFARAPHRPAKRTADRYVPLTACTAESSECLKDENRRRKAVSPVSLWDS